MKALKFLTAALIAVSITSCRNSDVPEDIHEHEEANKITLTINETGTANSQTVSYQAGTGASAPIQLVNGKVYDVSMAFLHNHNGVDENMTSEIITEKNEHFVKYQFAGVNVNITRAANDEVRSDGKKLGIKTQWAVTSAPTNAFAIVQLVHGASAVDDVANNGGGSTTGGEADVNAQFTVN